MIYSGRKLVMAEVLMILSQRFEIQTSQRFLLQTSHGEGLSVLDLPSYVFKGVILTFKKIEALRFIRSCQVSGDVYTVQCTRVH